MQQLQTSTEIFRALAGAEPARRHPTANVSVTLKLACETYIFHALPSLDLLSTILLPRDYDYRATSVQHNEIGCIRHTVRVDLCSVWMIAIERDPCTATRLLQQLDRPASLRVRKVWA